MIELLNNFLLLLSYILLDNLLDLALNLQIYKRKAKHKLVEIGKKIKIVSKNSLLYM